MKTFFKWSKRIGIGLITLVVLSLFVGFIFEIKSRNDAEKNQA